MSSNKRGEDNYLAAFQKSFVSTRSETGLVGKQFSMTGYGIADFVWITAQSAPSTSDTRAKTRITAFELKLRDWRRAFHQAYRYSYFADCAVVVLPPNVAARAKNNIHLFQQYGIGLWIFDQQVSEIEAVYQPDRTAPRNPAAKDRAITALRRRTKFRNLFE